MTHEEIQQTLELAQIPQNKPVEQRKNLLLRPCDGATNFCELPTTIVMEAFNEITRKIDMKMCGVDEFTNCEKLVYMLLVNHAKYGQA